MSQIQQDTWETITHHILHQKSILFIGSGITVNYGELDSERHFFRSMSRQHEKGISAFHEQDGLLIYKQKNFSAYCEKGITDFYGQGFVNPLLEKIAEIPFHLIITATPDLSLNKVFKAKGFDFDHHHLKRVPPQSILENTPTREKPLIYSLLGCVENGSSLITSHRNIFDLINQIYSNGGTLPKEVRLALNTNSISNIIFLGFDFDKWYFQLVLNMLGINYDDCLCYALGKENLHEHSKMLYESHFNVEFVSEEPETFINTLHAKFQIENLRKPTPKKGQYKKREISNLLKESFDSDKFEHFCYIEYNDFHETHFTSGQSQESRILAFLKFIDKKNLFEDLLDKIREYNPVHLDKYGPYYEEK